VIVGCPKEIKNNENRVALLPSGVEELVRRGHRVVVEKGAGLGSGVSDEDYVLAGAEMAARHAEVFRLADLIVKVKEPMAREYRLLKPGQLVFTYFHFAANRPLTEAMIRQKIVAVAYETIRTADGELPLLTPMSEIAGRMAIQEGAKYLEKPMMGRGILLGGVPGVAPAQVVILGGGVVGSNAAKVAAGLGARVTILDVNLRRLRYLDDIMPPNVVTLMSNTHNVRDMVTRADLLIGAVLIEGARAPTLVNRAMLKTMKPGAVIIDVAVDQGGCVETCKPTTHSDPTYVIDGVVHYCVANMPGAVGRTSTYALTNATFPYVMALASRGEKAWDENPVLRGGVNLYKGKVTYRPVADTFGLQYEPLKTVAAG